MPSSGKRTSALRKARAIANLQKRNICSPENRDLNDTCLTMSSESSDSLALQAALEKEQGRVGDYKRRLHNAQRRLQRALASKGRLWVMRVGICRDVANLRRQRARAERNVARVCDEEKHKILKIYTKKKEENVRLRHQNAEVLANAQRKITDIELNALRTVDQIRIDVHEKMIEMQGEVSEAEELVGKLGVSLASTCISLRKSKNTLRMRNNRAVQQQKNVAAELRTYFLKEKGVITDEAREMVRELVQCGVPVEKINWAIHVIASGIGVDVVDSLDKRSVAWIVLEGKVASQMQLVEEMHNSGGK